MKHFTFGWVTNRAKWRPGDTRAVTLYSSVVLLGREKKHGSKMCKHSRVMYALSSQLSLLSVCGRSCFEVTARLSPGLHFARFVTQPEVKFHVFRGLKRGEENSISKNFL